MNFSQGDPLVFAAQLKEGTAGGGTGGGTTFSVGVTLVDNAQMTTYDIGLRLLDSNSAVIDSGSIGTGSTSVTLDGIADQAAFTVDIQFALTAPQGVTCVLSNESGTISGANVTDVVVTCNGQTAPTTYSLSGSISNPDLLLGQWELRIGGSTSISNDGGLTSGATTFGTAIADGSTYAVTTSNTNCSVANGTGTVSAADITNITITCTSGSTGGGSTGAFAGFPAGGLKPVMPDDIPTVTGAIGTDPRSRIPDLYAAAGTQAVEALTTGFTTASTRVTWDQWDVDSNTYTLTELNAEGVPFRQVRMSRGIDTIPMTADDIPMGFAITDISLFGEVESAYDLPIYIGAGPGDDNVWFTADDEFVENSSLVDGNTTFYLKTSEVDNHYMVIGSLERGYRFDPGPDGLIYTSDDRPQSSYTGLFPYSITTVDVNGGEGQVVFFNNDGADDVWFTSDDGIAQYVIGTSNSEATQVSAIVYHGAVAYNNWFSPDDDVLLYTAIVLDDQFRPEYVFTYMNKGADGTWFTSDDPITAITYYGYNEAGEPALVAAHTGKGADGIWFTADDQASALVSAERTSGNRGYTELYVSISGIGADGTWLTGDDTLSGYNYTGFSDSGKVTQTGGYINGKGPDGLWFTEDDAVSGFYTQYAYDDQDRKILETSLRDGVVQQYQAYGYDAEGEQLQIYINNAGPDSTFFTPDDSGYNTYVTLYDNLGNIAGTGILSGSGPDAIFFTEDDVYTSVYISEEDVASNRVVDTTFSSPGDDGDFFATADNVISSIFIHEYLPGAEFEYANRVAETTYSEAGTDGIWRTGDDVVSYRATYVRDGDLLTATYFDGDNVITGLTRKTVDSQGRTLSEQAIAAGDDGIFDTADDTLSYAYRYEYDSAGNTSLSGFTYSNGYETYDRYEYDADGVVINIRTYNKDSGAAGPDGIMYTSDDIATSATLTAGIPVSLASLAANTGYEVPGCMVDAGATGNISVHVRNSFGQPVENAVLMLGLNGTPILSDASGNATFSSLVGPQDLHVMKDGYRWESFYCVEPGTGNTITSEIHPFRTSTHSAITLPSGTQQASAGGNNLIVLLGPNGELLGSNVRLQGVGQDAYGRPNMLDLSQIEFYPQNLDSQLYVYGTASGTTVNGELWAFHVPSRRSIGNAVMIAATADYTTVANDDRTNPIDISITYPEQPEITLFNLNTSNLRWMNGLGVTRAQSAVSNDYGYSFPTNMPSSFVLVDMVTNTDSWGSEGSRVMTAIGDQNPEDVQPRFSYVVRSPSMQDQDANGLPDPTLVWEGIKFLSEEPWYVINSIKMGDRWLIHVPAGYEAITFPTLPSGIDNTVFDDEFFNVHMQFRTNGGASYQNAIESDGFRKAPIGVD